MMSSFYLKQVWHYALSCFSLAVLLTACGFADLVQDTPTATGSRTVVTHPKDERSSVFGPSGLDFFGAGKSDKDSGSSGIGINSFLWRASLDTLSFMPLNSADPFGGVIITDWYSTPENPDERFKMTVYILDRRLRADAIKVGVFKQTRGQALQWLSANLAGDTAVQLENAILIRARQLRLDTIEQ